VADGNMKVTGTRTCRICTSCSLKGQCHEIFDFRFFTWISFPPASDDTIKAVSNFFRKFAEIFAAQGASPVALTPSANGKNLQSEKFSLFLLEFGKFATGFVGTGGSP
jgi:hypothetical protein